MKTVPEIRDMKVFLEDLSNPDICETLQATGVLEDAIFHQLERVQVLSAMQCRLDTSDPPGDLPNRAQYSQLLDDQIKPLRQLLDRYIS